MNLRGFTPQFYSQDGTTQSAPPPARLERMALAGAARGGYKQAKLRLSGSAVDLLQYYYLLGRWLPVFAPDGQRCWDGVVYSLKFSNGLTYDLGDVFNAVDMVYSSDIGVRNNTGWNTDANSIARYGRKELVDSRGGLTLATAQQLRDYLLYFHAHSAGAGAFPIPAPALHGPLTLDLTAYGWYATLGWDRWVQTAEGAVDTGTQIYDIVTSSAFVTATTTTIPTTGRPISQYRPDQNYTLLQEVERLAQLGAATGASLWVQVWNDRVGYLNTWGGGDFPALDYQLGPRGVYAAVNGQEIPLWLVRADRVIQTPQYQPLGFGVFADALDTPTALYLLETELQIDEHGLALTGRPAGWRDFVQILRVAG